jgi:hypothetical protein
MTQYRPAAPFRAEAKAPPPAVAPNAESPESSGRIVNRLQDPTDARARPRRIVTVADMKGREQEQPGVSSSAAGAAGRPSAPAATPYSKERHPEEGHSEGRQPEAGGSPRSPTPNELRQYIVGLLARQPATSRQRLLLDLLLEDLKGAPVAPGQVPLPTRLTVIMAHRLGYSVETIAEQVFGDSSQKTRRRAEEILAKGVDFELLERLFELAARA